MLVLSIYVQFMFRLNLNYESCKVKQEIITTNPFICSSPPLINIHSIAHLFLAPAPAPPTQPISRPADTHAHTHCPYHHSFLHSQNITWHHLHF